MREILVFIDDNCPSCRAVVASLATMAHEDASLHLRVVHRHGEPGTFARYNVHIVPAVFINGALCFYGECTSEEIENSLNKAMENGVRNEKT